jgi:hypothetical protein
MHIQELQTLDSSPFAVLCNIIIAIHAAAMLYFLMPKSRRMNIMHVLTARAPTRQRIAQAISTLIIQPRVVEEGHYPERA